MKAVFKNSMGLDMFEATQLAKTRVVSPRDAHHGYKAVVVEEDVHIVSLNFSENDRD